MIKDLVKEGFLYVFAAIIIGGVVLLLLVARYPSLDDYSEVETYEIVEEMVRTLGEDISAYENRAEIEWDINIIPVEELLENVNKANEALDRMSSALTYVVVAGCIAFVVVAVQHYERKAEEKRELENYRQSNRWHDVELEKARNEYYERGKTSTEQTYKLGYLAGYNDGEGKRPRQYNEYSNDSGEV